jgi:ribosomal protein S14
MKNFFYKNKKKLYTNKELCFDHLLKKVLKLKRKNNSLSIDNNKIMRKTVCIESKSTRSVAIDFSLSRMNIKKGLDSSSINGLKKLS